LDDHENRRRKVTEQTKTGGAGFVEDLGPLFEMWGDVDGRECLAGDLAEMGAEQMEREFRHAVDLLDGLTDMAESTFGFGAMLVLADAKHHAKRAHRVAEGYARGERG
jgi:hypothetical protein